MPSSGGATRPATEVTLTIVPLPRSRICGSTAWIMRSAPKKFVSNMRLPSSIGSRSTGPDDAEARVVDERVDRPAAATAARDRRVGVDVEREPLRDVEILEHSGRAGRRDHLVPPLGELDRRAAAEPASNTP